jgi:hypothetical protein
LVDLNYLRRHYASLSDDGLLAIDATELVDAARRTYDEEIAARGLEREEEEGGDDPEIEAAPGDVDRESTEETDGEPDWLGDATVAATFAVRAGTNSEDYAVEARDALEAAGIECHLSRIKIEPPQDPQPREELRLMIPSKLSFNATSVLDKEIFNREEEALWKAHFEELSDDELRAVDLRFILAGLRDRIERATRAYQEELAQREITPRR